MAVPGTTATAAGGEEYARPRQYGGFTGPEQVAAYLSARTPADAADALARAHPSNEEHRESLARAAGRL